MAQKKQRPVRTRNGVPLTRDEYRQMKRAKEREDRRKRQEAWRSEERRVGKECRYV